MEENGHPLLGIVNKPGQFSYENGIEVTCIEPGLARGVLRAGPGSVNPHGMIHGGCACSTVLSGVTVISPIEVLRPAEGVRVCEATPKKLGSKLSVVQTVITDTRGKTVATGTFTFFMAKPERESH